MASLQARAAPAAATFWSPLQKGNQFKKRCKTVPQVTPPLPQTPRRGSGLQRGKSHLGAGHHSAPPKSQIQGMCLFPPMRGLQSGYSPAPQTPDVGILGTLLAHTIPPKSHPAPQAWIQGTIPVFVPKPGFRAQSLCFSLEPGFRAQPLHPPSLSQSLHRGLDSGHNPCASFQTGIRGTAFHPPRLSQSLHPGQTPRIVSHPHLDAHIPIPSQNLSSRALQVWRGD